MGGVSGRKLLVAAHDHEILVIVVGGAVALIVAAGNHHTVRGHGIDHNDLVVDDGMALRQLEKFFLPISEFRIDAAGAHHGGVIIDHTDILGGTMDQKGFVVLVGVGVGSGAIDQKARL